MKKSHFFYNYLNLKEIPELDGVEAARKVGGGENAPRIRL